jgi:hypothetical protein
MPDPPRRFLTPWQVDKIPGGYVVRDAASVGLSSRVVCYEREIIKAATHTPASMPSKNSTAVLTDHFRRFSRASASRPASLMRR